MSHSLSAVWLYLLLTKAFAMQRCAEILDAGLVPLVKNHIGIHFFVTVVNRSPDPTEVEVSMVQCCEDFPGGMNDCTYFHLIPETRTMDPNTTRNFTLIHPTMYPYNRRGECLLGVRYTTSCNRTKETHQHIAFDTALTEENVRCHTLHGFTVENLPACRSYDEDALDDCKMVDCHKKYLGRRSYFNRGSRLCEPVPPCLPTKRRGMPDVVYDVNTNGCSDLSGCLSDDDLQHLSHADLEPECAPYYSGKMSFVNCHHGEFNKLTGECDCQLGYSVAIMPEEPGSPRTQMFHSCNLDTSCWTWEKFFSWPERRVILTAFFLALLVALIVLFMARE